MLKEHIALNLVLSKTLIQGFSQPLSLTTPHSTYFSAEKTGFQWGNFSISFSKEFERRVKLNCSSRTQEHHCCQTLNPLTPWDISYDLVCGAVWDSNNISLNFFSNNNNSNNNYKSNNNNCYNYKNHVFICIY